MKIRDLIQSLLRLDIDKEIYVYDVAQGIRVNILLIDDSCDDFIDINVDVK